MRHYRIGSAHEDGPQGAYDLDSECRKPVLQGEAAVRLRDIVRHVRSEDEPEILCGKVARDHRHVLISSRPTQRLSQIVPGLKGRSSRALLQEFPRLRKQFWGRHLCARGYLAVVMGTVTDEAIRAHIDEQAGEPVADDSRFRIDS